MRIKFLTSVAGINYSYAYGAEVEWKDEVEALRFINSGAAALVLPRRGIGNQNQNPPPAVQSRPTVAPVSKLTDR